MTRRLADLGVFAAILCGLAALPACDDDTPPGGDADVEECDASWACCEDRDCSDGVFCNGLEVCDAGTCVAGEPPDCSDGLSCTDDSCEEAANVCVHAANDELCADGDLCDGVEMCAPADFDADPVTGCVEGMPMVCDDGEDCTQDSCADNACVHVLRDADGDTFADMGCAVCDPDHPSDCDRGTDCDDGDATIFPGATEVCDDGQDNDCDRRVDYADDACTIPNDGCDAALELTTGVDTIGSTREATGDIASACSPDGDLDVAFTFSLAEARDVEISVATLRRQDLTLSLATACGEPASELRCATGQEIRQVVSALPAGDYVAVVSAADELDFTIRVDEAEPAARPGGDVCETAVDVSEGGHFEGSTVGHEADYEVSCSMPDSLDAAFVVDVAETTSLELRAEAGGEPLAIGVQAACGMAVTEEACFAGAPADGWVRHLSPGRYFIVVQSLVEVDFTLDVTFMPTSADACGDAIDITSLLGTSLRGTTVGMAADIDTACGPALGPDSVYSFDVAEPQDVAIDFVSHGEATTVSLASACAEPGAELRCATGEELRLSARAMSPGTYYVVATGLAGADYELTVTLSDPVPPTLPQDLCEGAADASAGGVFVVDTMGAADDYDTSCGPAGAVDVAYVIDLAEPRSLDLVATAGTGPVTVALQPACGIAGAELACATTAATAHRLVRRLDAGRYFVVVETPSPDSVEIELTFGDPVPLAIEPYVPNDGHVEVPLAGMPMSGQYNIDISPLTFPFNGETYDRVSVSVNGFVRFGNGAYTPSAGSADAQTDIDDVYPLKAQVSWLGGEGMSGTSVTAFLDLDAELVIITYLGHSRLGMFGENDVQVILNCATGDVQVSYVDCLFGNAAAAHWSIGVSEPFYASGSLQGHDFPSQPVGTIVDFGPGAIDQSPVLLGAAPYLPLDGHAILFARRGPGWSVLVDALP